MHQMISPICNVFFFARAASSITSSVLGVTFLRRFCEVETASENRVRINDHDLVMRNRVLRINECRHAFVQQKIGPRCSSRFSCAIVQYHQNFDPTNQRRPPAPLRLARS